MLEAASLLQEEQQESRDGTQGLEDSVGRSCTRGQSCSHPHP